MSYKDTINLPDTDFSMRAGLSELEPRMQQKWDEMDLYQKIRDAREGRAKYILHDGPPYPTGDLHIGTGLNKILKDFLVRFATMRGYDAPYVPGWDCHGLPIELQILQELGDEREDTARREIRRMCREHALNFVGIQKEQFRSLGVMGDWDNPYLTLNEQYEAGILEVFEKMVERGYVYRDLKPIHWCYHCRTALAEAELEYSDIVGPSIFVNFPMESDVSDLFDVNADDDVNVLIWTTTPWTLPANLAVAVHPKPSYTAVRYEHPNTGQSTVSIMADVAVDPVLRNAGVEDYERLGKVKGTELEGLTYRHPFIDRSCPVLLAHYVTLSEGTGCVHTAPGHGAEDYQTGLENELEILSPVGERGYFSDRAGMFAGQHIEEADDNIINHLVEEGYMLDHSKETHSYPHCWRCHSPVIFRATDQWFVRMEHNELRKTALEAIKDVDWVPNWGEQRISNMVEERPDWCISRQRSWGLPIPAFYCEDCGNVLLTAETVASVREVFAEEGSDSWFEDNDASKFLPEGTTCEECGGTSWEKETDIFDVWFESGSSHNSVCRKHPDLDFPADMYLEGTDQYRGWFQLSLLPSVAAWDSAPFKTVLTHGFVVDEEGKKMSKSLGNFIGVEDGVDEFTAEILRLWTSSVDFRDQISVSTDYIQKNMSDAYRRVRNTFRFMLGNLSDYDPAKHAVDYSDMTDFDRWALDETARLVDQVTKAFEDYQLHRVYTLIHNFCAVQMSSIYLDALKDRLYCSGPDWTERRSAQTVLHRILLTLVRLIAPILVHTAEEVWSHIEHKDEDVESIHLAHWPEPGDEWLNDELHERWEKIIGVREDVMRAIESLRDRKVVSKSMEAVVSLWAEDESLQKLLRDDKDTLTELLMVSELTIPDERPSEEDFEETYSGETHPSLVVAASPSDHEKCARCWNLLPTVGQNADHDDLCERCVTAVEEQQ